MRIITIATAALLALSSAALADETTISSKWSLDTEVKATHMVDAETNVLTINPEMTYAAMDALDLTVGTTFKIRLRDVKNSHHDRKKIFKGREKRIKNDL